MEKYWVQITDRLQMSEVVRDCGLQINRAGFVCCPFHNEKTPSMKIYDKGYYCFGCHAHGNVITFIEQYYNLPFKDACRKLNQDFNLGLEDEIDGHMSALQKRILAAKINSDKIRKEEAKRIERIESGHILCSDIDTKYQDLLYETITEPSMNELLEKCGLDDYVDHNNYEYEKPNVVERFRSEKVGTVDFDNLVNEYCEKVDALWRNALLNKKIREEEQSE